jgi:hypothetical protein
MSGGGDRRVMDTCILLGYSLVTAAAFYLKPHPVFGKFFAINFTEGDRARRIDVDLNVVAKF